MYERVVSKCSKLKNFAPKILLCVQLIVLSIRNANIVSDGKASELGIWNFELGNNRLLITKTPFVTNYSVICEFTHNICYNCVKIYKVFGVILQA